MRHETQRVAERVRELLAAPAPPAPAPPGAAEFGDAASGSALSGDAASSGSASSGSASSGDAAPEHAGRGTRWRLWVQRLAALVPVRVDPGRRAALGVGVAVVLVAAVAVGWLWWSGPRATDVGPGPGAGAGPGGGVTGVPIGTAGPQGTGAAPSTGSGATGVPAPSLTDVVVDVAGRVARPGVYHLPAGSRVADALAAAGGPRRGVDLTGVNLAARLLDGQQILVGVPGGPAQTGPAVGGAGAPGGGVRSSGGGAVSGGGAGAAAPGASGPVDLNTATSEQLQTLPGIGPALAQRILDYRAAHGPFTAVGQLNDVSGIGDVKFAALAPLVSV